jgi:hypothetical protein
LGPCRPTFFQDSTVRTHSLTCSFASVAILPQRSSLGNLADGHSTALHSFIVVQQLVGCVGSPPAQNHCGLGATSSGNIHLSKARVQRKSLLQDLQNFSLRGTQFSSFPILRFDQMVNVHRLGQCKLTSPKEEQLAHERSIPQSPWQDHCAALSKADVKEGAGRVQVFEAQRLWSLHFVQVLRNLLGPRLWDRYGNVFFIGKFGSFLWLLLLRRSHGLCGSRRRKAMALRWDLHWPERLAV